MTKKAMANDIVKKIYPDNSYLQAKMFSELYTRKTVEEVKKLYSVISKLSIA